MLSRLSTCYRLTRPCLRLSPLLSRPYAASADDHLVQEKREATHQHTESEGLTQHHKNVIRRLASLHSSADLTFSQPPASEIYQWKPVTEAESACKAISAQRDLLADAPVWVAFYLLSCKVHTPQDAMAAINLALRIFPRAGRHEKAVMLLLSIQVLAQNNVSLPIPKLVKLFLILDLDRPATRYNTLLRNMSRLRSSPSVAKATTEILQAMDAHGIELHFQTYTSLLTNQLVTLELAKMLEQRMARDDVRPDLQQLTAYLRIFARGGAVHSAARYLNLIKFTKEERGKLAPHGISVPENVEDLSLQPSKDGRSVVTGHNTLFLRSFAGDSNTAFQFLRQMVDHESKGLNKPKPLKRIRFGPAARKSRLPGRRTIRGADWVTMLNGLSRDKGITGEMFFKAFDASQKAARYGLSVPVFTVLMRGLVKKGDYAAAEAVWRRCCSTHSRRKNLDARALTIAMDVLIGNNKALEAFDTLLTATGILDQFSEEAAHALPKPTLHGRTKTRQWRSKRATTDTTLVNALMYAFLRHGRPELVFKLWDAYFPLFGVHPDSMSLTAILLAAEKVARFDHTFRGVLEQLGLHNLFSSTSTKNVQKPFSERSKVEIIKSLRASIGMQRTGLVPDSQDQELEQPTKDSEVVYVRKSIWNGKLAAPKALSIFREIMLGNFPGLQDIRAPAQAVWSDEAKSINPMRDVARMLGFRWLASDPEPPKPAELTSSRPRLFGPSRMLLSNLTSSVADQSSSFDLNDERAFFSSLTVASSSYPQIGPTREMFAAYISLLGALSRSSEIAMALAWMRHLDVIPARRELADALALWSEASMRGPWLESIDGTSEFKKLNGWCMRWVGENRMPREEDITEAFGRLKLKRDGAKWRDEL